MCIRDSLRASAKISSSTVSWPRPLLVLHSALGPLLLFLDTSSLQRGPTIGGKIMPPTTEQSDFSALQTSPSRISALALALESVGEDSSPTLSWPQFWPPESVGEDSSSTRSWPFFFDTSLMASFFCLVRASAKILRPRSHGFNFWPPESVGEDFLIDGLVAPPSPSVVLCSRASPPIDMRELNNLDCVSVQDLGHSKGQSACQSFASRVCHWVSPAI